MRENKVWKLVVLARLAALTLVGSDGNWTPGVTARADSKDVVAGLEAGADEYLTKPIDQSERKQLSARLRRVQASFAQEIHFVWNGTMTLARCSRRVRTFFWRRPSEQR